MSNKPEPDGKVRRSSASATERDPSNPTLVPSSRSVKRKNVSIACLACRRGKAKCEGIQPCARCAERGIECSYPSDGRDRTVLKRKLEQVEWEKGMLSKLITSIRDAQDTEVAEIVSHIRSGATLAEIHSQLARMSYDAQIQRREVSPDISSMLSTTEVAISGAQPSGLLDDRNVKLRVRHVLDQPPYLVSAAPWTKITTDDHLVSHLVSLWVAWSHPWPDGVVLEYLLRDMQSCQQESLFCSSLLVEAILALGCIYSDHPETTSRSERHSLIIDSVIDNFEAHMRKEEGLEPTITNVQSFLIFYFVLITLGQDRRATQLMLQVVQLCDELLRDRHKVLRLLPDDKLKQEASYVLDVLSWSILAINNKVTIGLMHVQTMRIPERPFPRTRPNTMHVSKGSLPSTDSTNQVPDVHCEEILQFHAEMSVFEYELLEIRQQTPASAQTSHDHKLDALLDLDARLVLWHSNLPSSIKELSRFPIPTLYLRWWWLADRISILSTIKAELIKGDSKKQNISEDIQGECAEQKNLTDQETSSKAKINHVQSSLESLAIECANFNRIFRAHSSSDKLNVFMGHPIHQALYILLFKNVDNKYDDPLTELFSSLHAQRPRMPAIASVLQMIEVDIARHKLNLPAAVQQLFQEANENDAKQREAGKLRVLTVYPNLMSVERFLIDNETQDHPLSADEFLKAFGKLRVQDSDSGAGGATSSESGTSK